MLKLIKWSDGKKGSQWGYHSQAALGATWLFVGLHLRIAVYHRANSSSLPQSLPALESGSNAVFGWNHIDRVSSTTGAVRRGTPCLSFSLSQPLFFHKECVSHIVRCVSISNCSDGWRWTDRKEEWDGNQGSRIEEKELFYYNSITALSALWHGWRKTITQPAHAMKNETSSDIQNCFVLDEDKQSGYVCIHYIKSIAKPYQNNTSKIIKRGKKISQKPF